MSFDEVLSQESAVRLLKRTLRDARVASAYLFFGPEGVGKALTGAAFARAILCPSGFSRGDACGTCGSCVRAAAGTHPGLLTLSRKEGRGEIVLAQVHEMAEALSLRPIAGDRTVVLVRDAERLNEEGFNALLKSVEEPPPGGTFILTCGNREAVPETIRSRCQGVRFRPLPAETVARLLVAAGTAPEAAARVAAMCGGSMGRAQRLLAMSVPDRLPEISKVLDEETDPVEAAAAIEPLLAGPGGKKDREGLRERADEVLRVLIELTRVRMARGDIAVEDARFCFEALTRGLDNLRLNLQVDACLVSAFSEVLPRWRKKRST